MATLGQPINQADVQGALGVSTSVNKWSQLLTHANINMWSAYKPLYSTKKVRLTDAERASGAHTVSGYTASYGILKRISALWSDFINTATGAIISAPWVYDKPVVDGYCGLRITDYIGYRTDAQRLIKVTYSSWDLWLPSASGAKGSSMWMQLTGMSPVSDQNTGAMRWQELFGDHLNYYPTLIMTAGTNWVYAKSSDYTIQDLINRGDTGATIYVDTATLASAMINDGARYDHYPLNQNASWNITMVLCSRKVAGGEGSSQHNIISGSDNLLRCEYESGADRTTKTAKLIKYKSFASMKMRVTLVKEVGQYKYRIDKLELIAEKVTDDTVTFQCDATFTARIGDVSVQGYGGATGGQAYTADNYFGTITFAASDIGTITKTWQYGSTSGNALLYTYFNITQAEYGNRDAYGRFKFYGTGSSASIGSFEGGWEYIRVNDQRYKYEKEFTLF